MLISILIMNMYNTYLKIVDIRDRNLNKNGYNIKSFIAQIILNIMTQYWVLKGSLKSHKTVGEND